MSEFDQEFSKDKEKRRRSIKSKKNHRSNFIEDDNYERQHLAKKEAKRKKQDYLDEEWEKWNEYYNR